MHEIAALPDYMTQCEVSKAKGTDLRLKIQEQRFKTRTQETRISGARTLPLSSFVSPLLLLMVLSLTGCATSPPSSANNICDIFDEKRGWYKASWKAAKKWNGNIYVPMSIMYQESAFQAKAKPPMRFFAGIIPYGRPSNAYGYAQALDGTWAAYKRDTGSTFRSRSDFADAMDFIQWYMMQTAVKNRIPKTDGYRHYLNYHEGQGGYARGTYNKKPWLIKVAGKVQWRAQRYKKQLQQCSAKLERKRKWLF